MRDTAVRLEVRHLRLLLAIVEAGGLTRAGEILHLTQSALSHQLRDAEERLGVPLFHRVRQRLVLTKAGECLVCGARRVLAELRRAEAALAQVHEGGDCLNSSVTPSWSAVSR